LDLVNGFELHEYAWVCIQIHFADAQHPKSPPPSTNGRIVQVLFSDLIEDENTVYLSPQLWHNLRYQPFRGTLEQVFRQYPLEQPDAQLTVCFIRVLTYDYLFRYFDFYLPWTCFLILDGID